jgi:hypothetical protein
LPICQFSVFVKRFFFCFFDPYAIEPQGKGKVKGGRSGSSCTSGSSSSKMIEPGSLSLSLSPSAEAAAAFGE